MICDCGEIWEEPTGKPGDQAACQVCEWSESGTRAAHLGGHHNLSTGHRWTLSRRDAPQVVGGGCECWWMPEETWLSAASCGYGSGYEPGSQMEWNPDCPAHPPHAADLAAQRPAPAPMEE